VKFFSKIIALVNSIARRIVVSASKEENVDTVDGFPICI
jgi:hypothetical protein